MPQIKKRKHKLKTIQDINIQLIFILENKDYEDYLYNLNRLLLIKAIVKSAFEKKMN